MFVKKSADGNHAAVIQIRVRTFNVSGQGVNSKIHVDAALHSANPNPDPNYSCDGCPFLNGQDGEMHEGWGVGTLEQAIMDLTRLSRIKCWNSLSGRMR